MSRAFNALVALLSFGVAAYAIAAYALLPLGAVLHPDIRASFAAHGTVVVYLHVFGAAVALMLGPLQFWAALRARRPSLHRWLGRTYLALGVGVGGLSGFVLALNAFGGTWSRAGFGTLAVLWMATGVMAMQRILRGDVQGHRQWMMRNFSLTLAAVMLRLYLPASIVSGLSLELAYPVVAWLCWVPNLVAAEWLLSPNGRGAGVPRRAGVAGGDARRTGGRHGLPARARGLHPPVDDLQCRAVAPRWMAGALLGCRCRWVSGARAFLLGRSTTAGSRNCSLQTDRSDLGQIWS